MARNSQDPNADPVGGGSGGDLYSQIGGFFSGATGGRYTPTQQDVSQWGTNVDPNYLNTIKNQIYNVWAPQWLSQNPAQPAAPAATPDPTGSTAPTASTPSTGTFGDPAYNQLNNLANQRVQQLQQPPSVQPANLPMFNDYMSALQQEQGLAKQRAQTFADQMSGRISQLQQPLLSTADAANIQTAAIDPIRQQRDAMLKNANEAIYARGFAPTSGLVFDQDRQIQEAAGNQEAQVRAGLARNDINMNEQRKNEATQLQGLVQQALQGGDLTSLNAAAQAADAENQLYNLEQNRANQALTTANIPVDLSNMGFSNALAAGGGANPMSTLSALFPMINASMTQQGNSMSGIGGLLGLLGL